MYNIVAIVLFVMSVVHVVALCLFLKMYFQGRLMSVAYGMGLGGPKYITPFVTRFVKEKVS